MTTILALLFVILLPSALFCLTLCRLSAQISLREMSLETSRS
jgi:hypothetical protein